MMFQTAMKRYRSEWAFNFLRIEGLRETVRSHSHLFSLREAENIKPNVIESVCVRLLCTITGPGSQRAVTLPTHTELRQSVIVIKVISTKYNMQST